MKNETNHITITTLDKKRLMNVIPQKQNNADLRDYIRLLEEKFSTAKAVTSKKVPPTVVTMNSKVKIKNLSLGKALSLELVYPDAVDAAKFKISILSPLGAAMFGYSQGDEFAWVDRNGKYRFVIEQIIYQPESSGDYHL